MNIYQRIVLILGAIALIIAIWTSPNVFISYDQGIPFESIETRTASMRAVAVVGATVLIFFALKSKGKD